MRKLLFTLPILYFPSLIIFFSSDDWFHLRVSQINSVSQFLNFFSFEKTAQAIAFYRPLPTQVFFFILQKLFGLNPIPYHILVLSCFFISLILVYRLAKTLLNSEPKALFSTLIYAFSVSNFTRIYFLSAFQEISLVIFSLLCVLSYLRKNLHSQIIALLFFILALLSKETAVFLPLILLIIDWSRKKINFGKLVPYGLILVPYLYLRLFQFGLASGETYLWNFSPLKAANTLMWYVLWSIGAPELLVDYIGTGLRPIPLFFTNFPIWWMIILGFLLPTIITLIILSLKKIRTINRNLIVFVFLFLVSLGPVIFLPQHKFALELGLPLVWFSLAVAWLLPNRGKLLWIFFGFYLSLNLSMNYLTYLTHYSVRRGIIAKKVYEFVIQNYPEEPKGSHFEFINDVPTYTKEWGSSRQIANSIGGSEMFRVIYSDPDYNVYFEDYPGIRPQGSKITLSTQMFLP